MLLMIMGYSAQGQIVTPTARALFGVDGDVRANVFAGVNTDNDDWFIDANCCGSRHVIDTNGAAAMMQLYTSNPATRKRSFAKKMSVPVFSTIGNRLWYDAIMVRDHQGSDTTAFMGTNKNGQSPALWQGGLQPVPNKNDIKDVYVHVRRDGPSFTDSLYFLAGVALDGTTGNRYFDFELFQMDTYHDPVTGKFNNIGYDLGHTAWLFNEDGSIRRAGDIIFSAEFSSASLVSLEARIWIHHSARDMTPSKFNWGGAYDGDGGGAGYGYASIIPKDNGFFYAGTQNLSATWAGAYGNPSPSGLLNVNYDAGQLMEISVNLTKIGLDPYSLTSITNPCGLPFKRLFAKTRSATSFTSELKDFIGPLTFAEPAKTEAAANVPMFCSGSYQVSTLSIMNYIPTSVYSWSTTDGNIITSPATGQSIDVDVEGSYRVTQTLYSGCAPYSSDTVVVGRMLACWLLDQQKKPGINKPDRVKEIEIGPNPASDLINVFLPPSVLKAMVHLYDISGKRISTAQIYRSANKIDISSLSRGIYYVRVNAANGYQFSKKIIKQ